MKCRTVKKKHKIFVEAEIVGMILVLGLAGCTQPYAGIQPTQIRQSPSPTVIPSSSTLIPTTVSTVTPVNTVIRPNSILTPSSTLTVTPTRLDTLKPTVVAETIAALLRDPGDCVAPCFWGIVPGKTTYDEANDFFSHLGISPYNSTINGKDFANYQYHLNDRIAFSETLTLQNNVVENLQIKMRSEWSDERVVSDWMAYSPKALIQRYGKPSRVDLWWSLMEFPTFSIALYFNEYDLIGQFHSPDGPEPSSPKECPLAVNYDSIWLWMGKNPNNPPSAGAPLDEATSLTIGEFVNLMTGDPGHSCFNLNVNAFLPH